MKRIFYSLLAIVFFIACNESSIVEGIKPVVQLTKLSTGTLQSKSNIPDGVRLTVYAKSDLQVGKITVTYSNNMSTEKKVLVIDKYYPAGLSTCKDYTESSCDFDLSAQTYAVFDPSKTPVTVTYSAVAEDGSTWSGTSQIKRSNCAGVYLSK